MRLLMSKTPARREKLLVGAAAILVATAAAGLYETLTRSGNNGGAPCGRESAALAARLVPLASGEVAAFEPARAAPVGVTNLAFLAPDGRRLTIADFAGRTVLLNLWATWCEPCKREMPSLDRLQGELGGPGFEVVAVNIDTRNLDRPRAWLAAEKVARLAYYADSEARIFQDLRRIGDADGMPTTLLIDARGCRLGRMSGPAEWAGPDGLRLVKAALGG